MLTALLLIALAVLPAASIAVTINARRRLRESEAKLARIAATDDEILAVLEATESSLAAKLLPIARGAPGEFTQSTITILSAPAPPSWPFPAGDGESELDGLLAQMTAISFDPYKLQILEAWVNEPHVPLTPQQCALVIKQFSFDPYKVEAREILSRAKERAR